MNQTVDLKVYPFPPDQFIDNVRQAPGATAHPKHNEIKLATPVNNFLVKWERIEDDCWILYTLHQFHAPFRFLFQPDPAIDVIQLDFGLRLPPYVIETSFKQYRCEKTLAVWSNHSQFSASIPATPNTDSIRVLLGRTFLEKNIPEAYPAFLNTAPGQVITGTHPVYTRPLTPGEEYLLQRIFDFFNGNRRATATLAIKQLAIDLIRQFIEIALAMDRPAEDKGISVRITDIANHLQQQIFSKFPGIDALALRAGLSTHYSSHFPFKAYLRRLHTAY